MSEQVTFTLGEAAKAVSRSKSTLSKAIKSGRLSYMSREGGEYQIAASELFRVFPVNSNTNSQSERLETPEGNGRTAILEAQLAGLRGELEQVKGERDDLRRRLDEEAEERRKLTAILTDQRPQQQAEATRQQNAAILARLEAVEHVRDRQGMAGGGNLFMRLYGLLRGKQTASNQTA